MPKRRTIRKRRNRPKRPRVNRQVAQVSSGIPSLKRVRGNPPPINIALSQSVKVPFYISIRYAAAAAPFTVAIADTPLANNYIRLTNASSFATSTFYLDLDEIFQAAAVRVFGSKPQKTELNFLSSEFALQKVTFFGPIGSTSIKMGVDFGPGMPGAAGSDEGTMSSRPVVSLSTPRLYWERASQVVNGDAAVGLWIYGYNPTGPYINAGKETSDSPQFGEQGRIDCTVHVRRSWYSANHAFTAAAKAAEHVTAQAYDAHMANAGQAF